MPWPPLHLVDRTASTNDDLRVLAVGGAPHGTAVLAEAQTAGRGRRGRVWQAPPGAAIFLSVLVRAPLPPDRVALVCLGAAIATAEACGPAFRIKWPNDVLAPDGRKVAGILAEAEWERGALAWLIVGVGVNLAAAPPLPTATFVEADGVPRDRLALAEGIRDRSLRWAATLSDGPDPLLAAWRARADTLGKRVRVGEVEGIARDVDATGALWVRTDDGRQERILAGDVQMIT